jgi:hypothetical protein
MGAFRRGALIGFGIGYLQGAKAGRSRYEEIMQKVNKVDMGPVKEQGQKALSVVKEKTGEVKSKLNKGTSSAGSATGKSTGSSSGGSTPSSALPNTRSA